MSWFKRESADFEPAPNGDGEGRVKTDGLWVKCLGCRQPIWKADLEANLNVCPKCGHHFKISALARIDALLEPGYELVDRGLRSTDPLNFTDIKPYKKRLEQARKQTGLDDAIVNAVGKLAEHDVVLSVMEYAFAGGSMGAVVGETIARAIDRSLAGRKPLIVVASSGGARMQEGIASLLQMAKISSGLAALDGFVTDRTAWLIEHHDEAHRLRDGSLGARARRRLLADDDIETLELLCDCDRAGRVVGMPVPDLDDALDAIRALSSDEEE